VKVSLLFNVYGRDSAPEISHVDQLTIVVGYVTDPMPAECFLIFLEVDVGGHIGAAFAKRLLSQHRY